jgi:hypothetical protein
MMAGSAKVFFMGDIKFSAFKFQRRRGAALRAVDRKWLVMFSLFESNGVFTS